MFKLNRCRFFVIAVLTTMMSHLPQVATAEVINHKTQMISTSVALEQFNRKEAETKLASLLNKDEVKQKLIERGISPDEAQSRIASLSNQELQTLTVQMDEARYGGDILVTILVVVLIIYLIKRI